MLRALARRLRRLFAAPRPDEPDEAVILEVIDNTESTTLQSLTPPNEKAPNTPQLRPDLDGFIDDEGDGWDFREQDAPTAAGSPFPHTDSAGRRLRTSRRARTISWRAQHWQVQAAAYAAAGRFRTFCEDDFLLAPQLNLCAVADGTGGIDLRPSTITLKVLAAHQQEHRAPDAHRFACSSPSCQLPQRQRAAIAHSNASYHAYDAGRDDFWGGGATLAVVQLCCDQAHIAHVGDSRIYRLREGQLEALTTDHTLLNELLQSGQISDEEALTFPARNVITRAMGTSTTIDVDQSSHPLAQGDLFLLCSDGLHAQLSHEEISSLLHAQLPDLEASCEALVTAATLDLPEEPRNPSGLFGDDTVVALLHITQNIEAAQDHKLQQQKQALEDALFK